MSRSPHPRIRELKFTLGRIFRNPSAIIGFSLLFVFVAVAVLAPYIAPPKYAHNPYMMPHKGYSPTPKPPSAKNIFGTTSGQYDIFYGAVWGTRTAFKIGLFVIGFALVIGVALGIISGYYGGIVDEIIMRIVDIIYAVPLLVLTMAIVVAFGRGLDKVMIALALVKWRDYVRVMRSSILTLRELDYVQAARALGVSEFRIIWRHVLPNLMHLVVITFVLLFSGLVLSEAILSYLGIGIDGSWGQMIDQARDELARDPIIWWNLAAASTALFGLILAVNFVGDAIRDILDPRTLREDQ